MINRNNFYIVRTLLAYQTKIEDILNGKGDFTFGKTEGHNSVILNHMKHISSKDPSDKKAYDILAKCDAITMLHIRNGIDQVKETLIKEAKELGANL